MQNWGNVNMKQTERHCDDYIHDHEYPICLRWFLLANRLPAVDGVIIEEAGVSPKLFADYKGQRVRVVMASRMGDVGITPNLEAEHGYEDRVFIDELENFSEGEQSWH